MTNIVLVQQIRTSWTKASRGGPNARLRNAVPEAAKFPVQQIPPSALSAVQTGTPIVHHVQTYHEPKFSNPDEKMYVDVATPLAVGCVTISADKELVLAGFRYEEGCGGAPVRTGLQQAFDVSAGEWAQFVYNGRYAAYRYWSDGSVWWYEKNVINVGLFTCVLPSVFTQQAPTYRFVVMSKLF